MDERERERWPDRLAAEAAARLPGPVWRYYEAGAGDGVTVAEAVAAWEAVRFTPRVLRDVRSVDTTTELLGSRFRQPFGIAPTSLQRCADPEGELAMASAAAAVGVPHVVSSNAGHAFADIAAAAGGSPWWLQTYLTQRRDDSIAMIEAAAAAGASALVLTVDTPMPGTKRGVADADFADIDLSWHRVNYGGGVAVGQRGQWAADLAPDDVAWLRDRTGLPVVVKGVLHPEDARVCVEAGAAAVWVSNHGGRQLDRALPTAAALPAVRAAVPSSPVYVDGGVRVGLDVLAALATGADAVFLGRVPLYALAAGGRERVVDVLETVAAELREGLLLAGAGRPSEAPAALT